MNPVQARKRIIHIYQQTQNYCETARRCHTSPQRVRKWVKRYQQYGEQGLHDLPKTPKRQPRKTDPDIEQRVLQLHQKNPLRTPTPRPTPRPTRHSPLPQHHPTHPETPRTSNQPSPQTAPSLLSCALGVGEPRTVYAHPSRCQRHLRQGHARHRTLGSPAQASPPPLSVDCSGKSHALAPVGVQP